MRIPIRVGARGSIAAIRFRSSADLHTLVGSGISAPEAIRKLVAQFNSWAAARLGRRVCAWSQAGVYIVVSKRVTEDLDLGIPLDGGGA